MKKMEVNQKEIKKRGSKFLGEFKTFILRGNVMDLAVGVLIGAAFQGLVKSFTDNIISPILGSFSEVDFTAFALKIGNLNLTYGAFLTDVINFIIMAFVVFIMIKVINGIEHIGKKKEEEVAVVPVKSDEVLLLEEIRDLLKSQNKTVARKSK